MYLVIYSGDTGSSTATVCLYDWHLTRPQLLRLRIFASLGILGTSGMFATLGTSAMSGTSATSAISASRREGKWRSIAHVRRLRPLLSSGWARTWIAALDSSSRSFGRVGALFRRVHGGAEKGSWQRRTWEKLRSSLARKTSIGLTLLPFTLTVVATTHVFDKPFDGGSC